MEPLILKGTNTTFQVHLDKLLGKFEFSGKSRPENAVSFFEDIFAWFKKYEIDPNPSTLISFKLEYFNSSSAKVLLRFLAYIEELKLKGLDIKVNWYYKANDEDMLETGEDFSTLIDVPFEFIEFK